MDQIKKIVFVSLCVAGLSIIGMRVHDSFAKSPNVHHTHSLHKNLIDEGTLDEVSNSFTLQAPNSIDGYGILGLDIIHTNNAASAITMTCQKSFDAGVTWSTLQTCERSSGVCTSYDASWVKSVSGDDAWFWRVDVLGVLDRLACTFTDTGGGANDSITVHGTMMDQ
jgi:hypothetical protein